MQKQFPKLKPAERDAVNYLEQVCRADEMIALAQPDLAPHADAIKAAHVKIHKALSQDTEKGIMDAVGRLDHREKQVLVGNIDILTKGDPVAFLDKAAMDGLPAEGGFTVNRAGDVMNHPILAKIWKSCTKK